MTRPAPLGVAFASAAAATLAHAQNPPATHALPPLVEAVVYSTIRPPNQDIYLYERPGEAPRRLTDDPALDYNAVFSPDGRWLVFTSERAGSGDLYALDLEGGGASVVRLTRHRHRVRRPQRARHTGAEPGTPLGLRE